MVVQPDWSETAQVSRSSFRHRLGVFIVGSAQVAHRPRLRCRRSRRPGHRGAEAGAEVQAQDAVSGVGDSQGATSLLSVALGADALRLRVIGENSRTSNDPADGAPNALERVTPLSLTSTLVPALGGASAPSVETSSTGGEDVQTTPAVDLGGLHLDTLEVLDLQALDALGISLADLPLDAAIGLLDALGRPLPEGLAPAQPLSTINGLLTGTASARALAAPLQTQIDSLQAQLATATAQLSAAQGASSSNPACALPVLSAACASLQAQIATVSGAVSSLPARGTGARRRWGRS